MKLLRALVSLALVSCGGFLPFLGDDEEDTPPPPPTADANDDAPSDAAGANDGPFSDVDGGFTLADSSLDACKITAEVCVDKAECCSGHDCGQGRCCVLGGFETAAVNNCCTRIGNFNGMTWVCLDSQ